MQSKDIIAAIDRQLLKAELTAERFVRHTRKGDNEIYILNHHNAPQTMQEIGRLRELTFRAAGGGTGEPLDIDDYDVIEHCYDQLIVWDPAAEEIVGGYRFIKCAIALDPAGGEPHLSTAHYFDFTTTFLQDYLPKTIELGRSWVQPNYQPSVDPRKGLFALDNIWDGLGALTVLNPEIEYFFGKVTMYPDYPTDCRDFLLYFLHHYFPDTEKLMQPKVPLEQDYDAAYFARLLEGLPFREGYKVLNQFIRNRGENIPPLVNLYMQLSPTMKTFGTAVNPDFGFVEETGIMVSIADIYPEKKERYVKPMLEG
jgi:hypothetical protein